MYKRRGQNWTTYIDFVILDEIALQLALQLAYLVRHSGVVYLSSLYCNLAIALAAADLFLFVIRDMLNNVLNRGYYIELAETVKHTLYLSAIIAGLLFALKYSASYSRLVLFHIILFYIAITYTLRVVWKLIIKSTGLHIESLRLMLLVTTPEDAENIISTLSGKMNDFTITGVVLTSPTDARSIAGIPVVANIDSASDYIVHEWVDSVYINAPSTDKKVEKLMTACAEMGVPTHYRLVDVHLRPFSESISGTTVLTTSINYMTPLQAFEKRLLDIIGGLFGSIIALLLIIILGPIIKKQSPGPVIFAQERIGQDGKHFKMYKIRSMYMDAEERKKDYLSDNTVKDGMMFKLDFDPRIIGNKVLPDGTHKTGIGDFIRRTSLDEFPQFFNVLKGDMSLVGTRPPTLDEWEKYEYHHRARLAVKPGITGMWQVSGRSDITDFEEVVHLDTEYITNWSPGLDLRILFKTVAVIFTRLGAK